MICDTLREIWMLEVLCECITGVYVYNMHRWVPCTISLCTWHEPHGGMRGGRGGKESGRPETYWSVQYGKPLMTPTHATPACLSCTFPRSLTASLPLFTS